MKSNQLDKIFKEALDDPSSANLDGRGYESRMMHGVQIIRDDKSSEIKIFNPKGKDYYEELTTLEYDIFQEGWRKGVYKLVLHVYRKRLKVIEEKIPQILTNKKSLLAMKEKRVGILKKYYKITQKLNQLK